MLLDNLVTNVKNCISYGRTHVTELARYLHKEMITVLSEYDSSYNLPIHDAALCCKSLKFIQFIFEQNPVSIKVKGHRNKTVLHFACEMNIVEVVEYLYNLDPSMALSLDQYGNTPLSLAIAYSRNDVVRFLVTHCPTSATVPDRFGFFPLCNSLNTTLSVDILKLIYNCYPCAISSASVGDELPIHYLLRHGNFEHENDLTTNKLRFLVLNYQQCKDIKILLEKVYDLSLSQPLFVQRLILRAKPDMDLLRYHELNYNARRIGMFLGYKAKVNNNNNYIELCGISYLYRRMRIYSMDTFRITISFL
jgi:hypothetical protein